MGRRAGDPTPHEYYTGLMAKGVPRYAAGKALRAFLQRAIRARRLVTRYRTPKHRHRTTNFCGSCYERSKGR